jgi:hypothetical protein
MNSQSETVPNFSLAGKVALVTGAGRGIERSGTGQSSMPYDRKGNYFGLSRNGRNYVVLGD